jgi:hypothetical protein
MKNGGSDFERSCSHEKQVFVVIVALDMFGFYGGL